MKMSRASSQVRYSKTILSTKRSYISRPRPESKKKAQEMYKSQAKDINFDTNEFYIESKRVLTVEDILVNCFKLTSEKNLFILRGSYVVTDQYLSVLAKNKHDPLIKTMRCFVTDYNCTNKNFLMAFISKDDELRAKGVAMSHSFNYVSEIDRRSSVVLRTTFYNYSNTLKFQETDLVLSIIIEKDQVCSCYEYAPNKIIASTKNSIHLFADNNWVTSFSDNDSTSKYFKNSNDYPMGYFWAMPGFDEE